jgi:hypothetical protein
MIALTDYIVSIALLNLGFTALTQAAFFQTTCGGKTYSYDGISGFGFVPSDARDKLGDTISIGSSIAVRGWKKTGKSYTGILWGLPDRGWDANGTINYPARVHSFNITFTPAINATVENPSPRNLVFTYLDTILLTGPDGSLTSGLDPDQSGGLQYSGFPILPAATYPGDGFGGPGPGGKAISIDAEGLVVDDVGNFWISDEYGPYIYKFDPTGLMIAAIAPPRAILPLRKGVVSFSSNSPPIYAPNQHPSPPDPTQGRQNNKGFEGLTISPDGKHLYALLESSLRQEGGTSLETERYARLLRYSIKPGQKKASPEYDAEWLIALPIFTNSAKTKTVAPQAELHFISDTQFLILTQEPESKTSGKINPNSYRHVDIFDICHATDIKGSTYDSFNASAVNGGNVAPPEALLESRILIFETHRRSQAQNHCLPAMSFHQYQRQQATRPLWASG